MNLSVCIITKNEKENLRKCLEKLKGYGFELIVVDTGSTDGTVSMASEYTESIYEFPWCDDFAKAKNFAIGKATYEYILFIDSDEFIQVLDVWELEQLCRKFPRAAGRIRKRNKLYQNGQETENIEKVSRFFSKEYYRYEGKIHEQLKPIKAGAEGTFETSIEVLHVGYFLDGENKAKKAQRNIRILEEVLAEQGDDPYLLYQLGKAYYMMADYEMAREHFSKALYFELEPELEYVIDMVGCYGYTLLNCNRAEEALGYIGLEEAFGGTSDFQFLLGLIYMNNEMYSESIAAFQKAITLHKSSVTGADSYLANYNIGVIYECLLQIDKAMEYYWKCESYLPAVRQLGSYYEKKNPIQAYLYYKQKAYLCKDNDKQELDRLARGVQEKYHIEVPKTAIVILSYNTKEETRECIESIRANCIPDMYELIVVDNASSDGSIDWLKQQDDVKLLCNSKNQGYPIGCNQGIGMAEADSDIWLLNSDTLVPEHALFWLQMGLYETEKVGACGSMSNYCSNYQNINEVTVTSDNYQDYLKRHSVSVSNPYEKKTWLVGFSVLIKRKALSEIGLLDEQFSPGNSEDTDLGYRLAGAGWQQLLCKNSFVFHYGSRSFGRQKEKFSELIFINQQKFIEKWKMHPFKHSYIKTWEVEQIHKTPDDSFCVLDIGCGTGATLARIQSLFPKSSVYGIECASQAAKLAQMVAKVVCADVMGLAEDAFEKESMDCILTGGIWEYIADVSQLFYKMRQWLKPDGIVTGSFYNASHPFRTELPEDLQKYNIGICKSRFQKYYTAEEWVELLGNSPIVIDELSFIREPHAREIEIPYQYFWKGHYV